ncbi:MAG: zinc-dependent alcohol dehydrogenase family protein [Gemmataceae bacterium]|nr:zinc-dependent alcohol dehydrogenase family protein [Gemmataceae bacterium]MDW8266797.1 zinc-dependent alcohol dehydrogenase family protein [Gemmataceae bacterium]
MKAAIFERFGEPAEVLQLREVPRPAPGPGQVRVRMLASPINPSDLAMIRGVYGQRPRLPATPGFEGVGVVTAAGPGWLGRLRKGRRVAVLNAQGGNWQEEVVVPARHVVPIPTDIPDEQAACFFVNPATAVVMVRHVLRVPRGAWLLQTAAASALGRMVVRLGRHDGFRTLNVVRRREQIDELLRLGADAVVCTADEILLDRVRALTDGVGVPFAIDPVGGPLTAQLIETLARHGRLLVFGTLSGEPMTLSPRDLMVGHKTIEGFWLSEWARDQGPLTMLRLFRGIVRLMRRGVLTTEVAAMYPLEQLAAAVAAASQARGKVLLRFA